jgi:hypothetical protein
MSIESGRIGKYEIEKCEAIDVKERSKIRSSEILLGIIAMACPSFFAFEFNSAFINLSVENGLDNISVIPVIYSNIFISLPII